MAGEIKVSTDQVNQIAGTVEKLNIKLKEQLEECQKTIQNLSTYFEGEAATATISSFDEFAAKYFQDYYDVIDQYVKFLRTNVAEGYFETEVHNETLAESIKAR